MTVGLSVDQERKRQASAVAARFAGDDATLRIDTLGDGNINDTYLVEGACSSFVLQRINDRVFPQPETVVANFTTVTAHLYRRDRTLCPQWRDIFPVPAVDGSPFFRDARGSIWRAQSYLENTTTFSTIDSPERGRQTGWALGMFHRLLADLPAGSLIETLPGFHDLPLYLDHFGRVAPLRQPRQSPELWYCLGSVDRHRKESGVLKRAEQSGRLRPRIIHGDPKAANVLFDLDSDRAVCLIDLDTVRPGLLLIDIGDCLRSCCNRAGEEGDDPEAVRFDVDLAREIMDAYAAGAGEIFTPADRELVPAAVRLLAFELGLRFLTDYLDGSRYFKIDGPDDNLFRAMRQFRLLDILIDEGDFLR